MNCTLLDTKMASITRAHQARFARIDAEDFSSVKQWIRDERRKEGAEVTLGYLEHGAMSLKQYYAIMVLDPLNAHAAGPFITQFWHAHLETKRYRIFCEEIFGQPIDHTEIDFQNTDMMHVVRDMYRYTRSLVPRVFHGSFVDPNFWAQSIPQEARITCYQSVSDGTPEILQHDRLFEPRARCSRGPGFRTAVQTKR